MMMNAQQIFDKVAAHLLQQRRPARNEYGACSYRGAEGRMCAVGCLIPDSHYRPEFDSTKLLNRTLGEEGATKLWVSGARPAQAAATNVRVLKDYVPFRAALEAVGIDVDEHVELLSRLQVVHDNADDYREQLLLVCEEYGLSTAVLEGTQ